MSNYILAGNKGDPLNPYLVLTPTGVLNASIIQKINEYVKKLNTSQKIVVEIPNTRGVSSDLLRSFLPNIHIRVTGAYNNDFANRYKKYMRNKNGSTIDGQYYRDSVMYTKSDASIFTRNETIQIVSEMEKIEKGFEGQNFSQFEKMVYIYGKLKEGIVFDSRYEAEHTSEPSNSANVRSLRGFLSKKAVCAGYAVMFKEMLERQGIECHYIGRICTTREG